MKNSLLTFLKYFLIGVAVVLVILLVCGLVLILDWPWWVSIFLLLCIIGLGIGILFLKKLLLRRNEQRFVQQVIEQDELALKNIGSEQHNELKEMQNRWKEAVETLRRSHLKKLGNPLYVLPWYLVIGESGSGKTTAISSAHLSSPFVEVHRTSGISGTRNCDWWFFEQAIIIDTAGRYAIPVDEGKDKDEWQKFLSMIVKYRKKEPIHGLIVTVAADKLLSAAPEELEEDGKKIRRRMEELMRVLGIKFPVYLLVTKCDLVQGMTQFSDRLPEISLEQPMGAINQDLSKDVAGFLDRAKNSIGERLRTLRMLLLHHPESGTVNTGVLMFPEEFESLKPGLERFVKTAFQENPYQDTPLLRGLFFSSGRQEGTPYSHLLGALGLIGENEVLPGTSRGLFLHDFFAKVLPKDRGLLAPTTRAIEWQLLTRNLGVSSWIILWFALAGLLSYSFVKNLTTIREASHLFAKAPELKGDFVLDLGTMGRYRQLILKIEYDNQHWWIPRFGLNESKNVETGLKERYCRQFQDRFLASFDKNMIAAISGFNPATSDEAAGRYIVHLVRRINLLKARLESSDIKALQAKPLPAYVDETNNQGGEAESKKMFGYLYINYLVWRMDNGEINQEIALLQSWLKRAANFKGGNFQWLIIMANSQDSVPAIDLKSFWGGSGSLPNEPQIAPAYTRKGKESIDAFIGELAAAYPEPAALDTPKLNFTNWYRSNYFAAWQNFAVYFPRGIERLKGQKEWQQAALVMATDQGPYFAFLNKVTSELEPFIDAEQLPSWLRQAYQYKLLKVGGPSGAAAAKTADAGNVFVGKIEKLLGKRPNEATTAASSAAAASKDLQDYQNLLAGITPAVQSRKQAYQMAVQVFSEDQATSKSPFYGAYDAAARLKTDIEGGRSDDTIWKLVIGPANFLWTYVRSEATCSIQKEWDEKVLQEVQGAADQQSMQYLLGPDGPVWKFVKGPAAPFLGWSPQKGYYARIALGGSVPFDDALFSFLTKGAKAKVVVPQKTSYVVTIKGFPVEANPDARLKPKGTQLELKCDSGSQALMSLDFPASKTFSWSPDTCGDLILQIFVGEIHLTKKYAGPQAIPALMQEFRGGTHTFTTDDFPNNKTDLDHLGIKQIKVHYQFSGDHATSGHDKGLPGQAPKKIVRCWD